MSEAEPHQEKVRQCGARSSWNKVAHQEAQVFFGWSALYFGDWPCPHAVDDQGQKLLILE